MRRLLKIAAVLVLGLALLLGLPPQARAGRLLTSGFELNSTTAGVEWDAVESGSTIGSPGFTVQGSTVISGVYSGEFSANSGGGTYGVPEWTIPTMASGRTYYCRFNFRVHVYPTYASGPSIIAEFMTNSTTPALQVALTSTGTLRLYGSTAAQITPRRPIIKFYGVG